MIGKFTLIGFFVVVIGYATGFPGNTLAAGTTEYVEVKTRKDVSQPFLLLNPVRYPTAAVILFAGGGGRIGIKKSGEVWASHNFLVRSRRLFANLGFAVAVVDVPSDRRNLYNFRNTASHAKDIAAVIAYLKAKHNVPVWLIGTSRGSISAAGVAARHKLDIAGIVLTSSVFKGRKKTNLNDVALSKITVPTLFVHHKNDKCKVTPAKLVGAFMKKLRNVSVKEMKLFSGGNPPRQKNPCKALTNHGYIGIEHDVVRYISKWIVTH